MHVYSCSFFVVKRNKITIQWSHVKTFDFVCYCFCCLTSIVFCFLFCFCEMMEKSHFLRYTYTHTHTHTHTYGYYITRIPLKVAKILKHTLSIPLSLGNSQSMKLSYLSCFSIYVFWTIKLLKKIVHFCIFIIFTLSLIHI